MNNQSKNSKNMKAKHLILATLLLWAALPARALVYGIFEYEISGTRAVIKGLTAEGANSTTIDVPGLIPRSNGYHPYTTIIGTGAFKNNTKLKKVTVKWGCCMLEASAFEGCTALTELRIPSSMSYGSSYYWMGENCLKGCTSLQLLSISCT